MSAARERVDLAAVCDALPDGLWRASRDGRLVWANRALRELLGPDHRGEAGGAPWRELVAPAHAPAYDEAWGAVVRQGERRSVELGLTTGLVLRQAMAPLRGRRGEIVGVAGLTRDVTGEHDAALARRRALSQLAHDVRSPMVSVKGYVDLLLGGALGDVSDAQRRGLEIARRNVGRVTAIVDDAAARLGPAREDAPSVGPKVDLRSGSH